VSLAELDTPYDYDNIDLSALIKAWNDCGRRNKKPPGGNACRRAVFEGG